jgi:hypothetical protein
MEAYVSCLRTLKLLLGEIEYVYALDPSRSRSSKSWAV